MRRVEAESSKLGTLGTAEIVTHLNSLQLVERSQPVAGYRPDVQTGAETLIRLGKLCPICLPQLFKLSAGTWIIVRKLRHLAHVEQIGHAQDAGEHVTERWSR